MLVLGTLELRKKIKDVNARKKAARQPVNRRNHIRVTLWLLISFMVGDSVLSTFIKLNFEKKLIYIFNMNNYKSAVSGLYIQLYDDDFL